VSVELVDETSLPNPSQEGAIRVVPNPNNGVFQLISANDKLINCTLIDLKGRVIYTSNINTTNNTYSFNFSGITKGLYNLRLVNKTDVLNLKLVIK